MPDGGAAAAERAFLGLVSRRRQIASEDARWISEVVAGIGKFTKSESVHATRWKVTARFREACRKDGLLGLSSKGRREENLFFEKKI